MTIFLKNKTLITNFVSLLIILVGLLIPKFGYHLATAGFFALSGGFTNWLAIHMLFNKVPFFYGSGVILRQFKTIKLEIRQLLISEFFSKKNIDAILENNTNDFLRTYSSAINFDKFFDAILDAIEGSSIGNILTFIGGRKGLEPLRTPITKKLKDLVTEILDYETNKSHIEGNQERLLNDIEKIIDDRLKQLNPESIKEIIESMIKAHLGWLVVWGAIVGGIIGLTISFLNYQ